MRLFILGLMMLVIAGCSRQAADETITGNTGAITSQTTESTSTESSYADFINVEDKHYLNAWELVLVDASGIEEFGKVEQGTVVRVGTPVYSLPSYPEHNVVVVEAGSNVGGLVTNVSGYRVYVRYEGDGKTYYPAIEDQPVKQIQIYKEGRLLRELEGEDVKSFLALFEQHGPDNEFQFDKEPQYTVLLIGEDVLGFNYGVMEKDGQFGLTHRESRLPDAIADYFK